MNLNFRTSCSSELRWIRTVLVTLYEVHEYSFNHSWLFLFKLAQTRSKSLFKYFFLPVISLSTVKSELYFVKMSQEIAKIFHHQGEKITWTSLFRCQVTIFCLCQHKHKLRLSNNRFIFAHAHERTIQVLVGLNFLCFVNVCSLLKRLAVSWIWDKLPHLDFSWKFCKIFDRDA